MRDSFWFPKAAPEKACTKCDERYHDRNCFKFRAEFRPKRSVREIVLIPGHALHEKGLQRQKGAGPLVSSQEERALLVLLINRGKTGRQPRILFPHAVPGHALHESMKRVYRDK